MGCNCKKQKPFNNLDNVDYINQAKQTYNDFIKDKSIEDITPLDWTIIYQTYSSLYPQSSQQPSREDAINQIKQAIELYDVKITRRTRGR
jgi:hypothetical protein